MTYRPTTMLGEQFDSTLPSDAFLFSSDIKAWITAPETRPKVRRQTWYKKKEKDLTAIE